MRINFTKICLHSFSPARTPQATFYDIVNVDLSIPGALFFSNQRYPPYPQPTHLPPIDPTENLPRISTSFQRTEKILNWSYINS